MAASYSSHEAVGVGTSAGAGGVAGNGNGVGAAGSTTSFHSHSLSHATSHSSGIGTRDGIMIPSNNHSTGGGGGSNSVHQAQASISGSTATYHPNPVTKHYDSSTTSLPFSSHHQNSVTSPTSPERGSWSTGHGAHLNQSLHQNALNNQDYQKGNSNPTSNSTSPNPNVGNGGSSIPGSTAYTAGVGGASQMLIASVVQRLVNRVSLRAAGGTENRSIELEWL